MESDVGIREIKGYAACKRPHKHFCYILPYSLVDIIACYQIHFGLKQGARAGSVSSLATQSAGWLTGTWSLEKIFSSLEDASKIKS